MQRGGLTGVGTGGALALEAGEVIWGQGCCLAPWSSGRDGVHQMCASPLSRQLLRAGPAATLCFPPSRWVLGHSRLGRGRDGQDPAPSPPVPLSPDSWLLKCLGLEACAERALSWEAAPRKYGGAQGQAPACPCSFGDPLLLRAAQPAPWVLTGTSACTRPLGASCSTAVTHVEVSGS